jgi:hypothetical protein
MKIAVISQGVLAFCVLVLAAGRVTGPPNPYDRGAPILLGQIHDGEVFRDLPDILSTRDERRFAAFLNDVSAPDEAALASAFRGGMITGIWNSLDREQSRLAIGIEMNYDKQYAVSAKGAALFVFRYNGSKWLLEWDTPGTGISRVTSGSSG